jgi:hypothetical protein
VYSLNIDTGELRRLQDEMTEEEKQKLFKEGFRPVPQDLKEEAEKELDGKDSTMVDLKKKSSLMSWCKKENKKHKKSKRKMAKASRRKNRKNRK